MPGKREDYLSWEEYFLLICMISRERSKDPKTQVGAAIVKNNRVLAIGYNGTSKGITDDEMPWDSLGEKNGDIFQIKNSFVVHAEANALNNLPIGTDLTDAVMYVSLSPCPECAKKIAQTDITKVIYFQEYKNKEQAKLAEYILRKASIKCIQSQVTSLGKKMILIGQKIQLEEEKQSRVTKKIEYKKN